MEVLPEKKRLLLQKQRRSRNEQLLRLERNHGRRQIRIMAAMVRP